jgi:histidyl-tRNA synthetase
MIRLKDGALQSTDAFLQNAVAVAEYYGFLSLDEMGRTIKGDKGKGAGTKDSRKKDNAKIESEISFTRRHERSLPSAAKKFLSRMGPTRDTMLAWRVVQNTGATPSTSLELHILGTQNTIAEALLIIVAGAIAQEAGVEDRVVLINNIGSSESSGRYIRDVGLYLRKHIESISPTLRPRAATDPLGTLIQLIERGHPAVPRAPQAMEYLTEEERSRFWELLEYLEAVGLPYELNGQILGSRDCWSHSLFEISQVDAATGLRVPVAFGGRYDPLISRFARAPRNAAMISITYEAGANNKPKTKAGSRPSTEIAPAIYFTHLGGIARQRSLPILESLRKADIQVHHSLWHDRITEQMGRAQTLGTPYILIFGHKEASEGTIVVREVATNSQSSVPIEDLVGYLKRRRVITRPRVNA